MKKIFKLICFFLLITPISIQADNKIDVKLNKCVDGDTAWFNINDTKIKARFLAIDTPESTTKKEKYGKEASNFTCNLLTNSSKIQIEYDENSTKQDKYNRELVWVFVDDKLLQEEILLNGFADIKYIYGDYKYLGQLKKALNTAKKQQLNIWSKQDNTLNYMIAITGIIVTFLFFIFNKKFRKKMIQKTKKQLQKSFNKSFQNLKSF